MATDCNITRGHYKSITPTAHKRSGCSPVCPACGDNYNTIPVHHEVKPRLVDNTSLRREVFKRLANFRLDKNAANESIETADCRNEGYELEKTIGKGAYSVVKRARIKTVKMRQNSKLGDFVKKCGDDRVAVKIIMKESVNLESEKRFIEGECKALQRSKGHPNIIAVLDTFETPTHLYIVMEMCSGGDLIDYVTKYSADSGGVDDERARLMFKQLVLGLQHCHTMGVAHRDLKCDNILITEDETTLKISDFGFACTMASRRFMTDTPCGSQNYAAPEVIFKERYDPIQADIWSCGVILYCLTNGNVPYHKVKLCQIREVMQMQRLTFDRKCTPEVKHLVRRILQYDPTKRPKLCDILEDPWVLGIKLRGGERMFRDTSLKQVTHSAVLPEPFRLSNPSPDQQRLLFSSVRFGVQSLPSIIQLKSRLPNKERDLCLKTNFYKRRLERKNQNRVVVESPPMADVLQRIIDGTTNGTGKKQKAQRIARTAVAQSVAYIQQTLSLPSVKRARKKKLKKESVKDMPGSFVSLTNELFQQYSLMENNNQTGDGKTISEPLHTFHDIEPGNDKDKLYAEKRAPSCTQNSSATAVPSRTHNSPLPNADVENRMTKESDILKSSHTYPIPAELPDDINLHLSGKEDDMNITPVNTHSSHICENQDNMVYAANETESLVFNKNHINRDIVSFEDSHIDSTMDVDLDNEPHCQPNLSKKESSSSNIGEGKHFTSPIPPGVTNDILIHPMEEGTETGSGCLAEKETCTSPNDPEMCANEDIDPEICENEDKGSHAAQSVQSSESLRTATPGENMQPYEGDTMQHISRNSNNKFAGTPSPDNIPSLCRKNSATLPGIHMKAGSDIEASVKVSGLQKAQIKESASTFIWQPCGKHKTYHVAATAGKTTLATGVVAMTTARQRRLVPLQLTHVNVQNMESIGPSSAPPIMGKWNTPSPAPKVGTNRSSAHVSTPPPNKTTVHSEQLETSVKVKTMPLSDREAASPIAPPNSVLGERQAREDLDKVDSVHGVATWRLSSTPPLMERVNRALRQPSSSDKFPKIRNLRFESGNKYNPQTDKKRNQ